jgi:FMN phosphatase YigB (HAD superfamily)
MHTMIKKLIIFDLDNTLFKSKESYKYILAEVINKKWDVDEEFSVMAFDETEKEINNSKEYKTIKDFYAEFNDIFLKKILNFVGEKEIIEFEKILKQMKKITPIRLKTYPLVKEVLAEIKKRGYKIAILTGTWEKKIESFQDPEYAKEKRDILERLLKNSGLDKIIDKLFITYEYATVKPDPKSFKIVLDYFDVKPEEAIMVGDKEADLLAHEIGISSILFDPKKIYSGATFPDKRIKFFPELLKVMENYN